MEGKTIITVFFIIAGLIGLLYLLYQLVRNEQVFKIRQKWIWHDDLRRDKYSYSEMMNPSKTNWYGLKYPKDRHYQF